MSLEVTVDPFHCHDSITQAIKSDHATRSFEISSCHIRKRGYLSGITPSSATDRIRNVCRKYIGAYIVPIDGVSIFPGESIILAMTAVAASDAVFTPDPRCIPVSARAQDSPLTIRRSASSPH